MKTGWGKLACGAGVCVCACVCVKGPLSTAPPKEARWLLFVDLGVGKARMTARDNKLHGLLRYLAVPPVGVALSALKSDARSRSHPSGPGHGVHWRPSSAISACHGRLGRAVLTIAQL